MMGVPRLITLPWNFSIRKSFAKFSYFSESSKKTTHNEQDGVSQIQFFALVWIYEPFQKRQFKRNTVYGIFGVISGIIRYC